MEVSGKLQADLEVCEPCRIDGSSTKADGFCEECEEYICNRCFRDHLKSKASRNHVLGSLSQGQVKGKGKDQGTQPCQKHSNYNLRYYCRKHDKVACGDCVVAEHTGCKMEFINDIAKHFESVSEFTRAAEQIKGIETTYKEIKQKQEKNRRENASMTEKVLAEIKGFRKELNEYLDNAEREIVMESKKLSKENDDLVSDLETKINQISVKIGDLRASLDTNLYKGDILFIRFVESKRLVSDVEQSLAEIKNKNYIKTFTFQPEERLANLIVSKDKIGTLNIVTTKSDNTSSVAEENKPQTTGSTKRGPGLSSTETGDRPMFPASKFKDPDPRARGFDVGKRVKDLEYLGLLYGTVTFVDPAGYVDVMWDYGETYRYKAGAEGEYQVELV